MQQTPHQLISQAGLRSTKARLAILQVISDAKSALSHTEILDKLQGIDRVTVYRVLDWLTEHQLIHKITGENRAWKFHISHSSSKTHKKPDKTDHQHAHLHCSTCRKVLCLHEILPELPESIIEKYQVHCVEINLKGTCQDCVATK